MRAAAALLCLSLVLGAGPEGLGAARAESGTPAAAERGRAVYDTLCWTCHGRYGRGDGPAASQLTAPLPDLTDAARFAGRSDQQIMGRLQAGEHTPMAIASVLRPEALADALAFIRTLSEPGDPASVLAGRDIYNASCWACHGKNGDGKGPAARGLEPQPRNFTSPKFRIEGREKEIYRAIAVGPAQAFHGSPAMPSYLTEWGRLTPQQIWDVIAYLKTFQRPEQ